LWVLFAGLSVQRAKADTIFTNFGPGMTYNTTVPGDFVSNNGFATEVLAEQFTATGNFTFTDARLALGVPCALVGFCTSSVGVFLETNSGGFPGTIIEQINFTGVLAEAPAGSVVVFNSALNPVLTAGTSYWLVAAALDSTTIVEWDFNSTGDTASGGNAAFNTSGSLTGPWLSAALTRSAFEIDGTPIAPVPEPATLLLFGSGLIALGARDRRRLLPK